MTNTNNNDDFRPTRFSMLVDGGSNLYRTVKLVSQDVRDWDGTDGLLALESNANTEAHAGFNMRVTGRSVRLHKWGMATIRVQVLFDGADEWIGADLLADAMNKESAVELATGAIV